MALSYSQWMWGFEVFDSGSAQNNKLDFVDAAVTYDGAAAATLHAGVYTPDELAQEVADAMYAATNGASAPTCTFDYSTLTFTLGGTSTFSLLFGTGGNASTSCHGLLGFDSSDQTTLTSYESSAVGSSNSMAKLWTAAEPNSKVSPVSAGTYGNAAQYTQRRIRAIQNVSDGMTVETVYVGTMKKVLVEFRALTTSERDNMEAFLDWAVTGKRFTWQPDKNSPNVMKLVLASQQDINDDFEWATRSETTYGLLTFYEQLS